MTSQCHRDGYDTVNNAKGFTLKVFYHVVDIVVIVIEFNFIRYWFQPIYCNRSSKNDIVGTHKMERGKLYV
jgi:hypothetical protein